MKTTIYVMTHRKFQMPEDPVYRPLHVGRALGADLGYPGDDTGDHISELNPYYGELTGLYWLWKNCHDVDNIGICHYRRYFWNDNKELLTAADYEQILSECDILVSNAITVDGTYLEYFGRAHNIRDMELTGEVIRELYPEDYPFFCRVMKGNRQYYGNLCAMKKALFDEYCQWLFSIFAELGDRVDVSGYDAYHKRLFGFLSENLLMVFTQARDLKVKEGKVGLVAEKAETVEFKLAVAQLVKETKFTEAQQLFYDYLKIRPDIELGLSDVRKEIPVIEEILKILVQQEQQKVENGLYGVSHDLFRLIEYVKENGVPDSGTP